MIHYYNVERVHTGVRPQKAPACEPRLSCQNAEYQWCGKRGSFFLYPPSKGLSIDRLMGVEQARIRKNDRFVLLLALWLACKSSYDSDCVCQMANALEARGRACLLKNWTTRWSSSC